MCEDVGVTGGEAGGRCSGNGGLRCERMQGDAAACDPLSLLKYIAWHNVCAELKLGGVRHSSTWGEKSSQLSGTSHHHFG